MCVDLNNDTKLRVFSYSSNSFDQDTSYSGYQSSSYSGTQSGLNYNSFENDPGFKDQKEAFFARKQNENAQRPE